MTHPGTDVPPPVQPAVEAPAEKSGAKKWLPIAGSVAVAGVLGVGSMTGWFGIGDPKVGDCVQMQGETSFEVVDCGAAEAEYKIVGIEGEEMTWPDFEAASVEEVCTAFESWEVALWIGDAETEPGTIYCSEPV